MGFLDRLSHAWNAFIGNETPIINNWNLGYSSSSRPDRVVLSRGNERSIVTSVYNRLSIDCASAKIRHVYVDENNRYTDEVDSDLNDCLSVEANKDQSTFAFMQDVVMSLFDEGCVAIVPIDTTTDIENSNSYDIKSVRVGKIIQWYPDYIKVEVYNDTTGKKAELIMPKSDVAIIENPFYAVMNERNSTLQRLIRKLNILDAIDEQTGAGKLDLIVQLPYIIKTDARRQQAEQRRADIEKQLSSSKYGIAYTDGTEHITQLNRPVESNILTQVEYLTSMLFSQLSITQSILDGTADEKTMTNYYNRTIAPIVSVIADEMNRKFLTKTARTQGQRIMYFNDPFKLVSVTVMADIADKFTRNEIMTSNEVRQIIGMKPVDDPEADTLRNKNLNSPESGDSADISSNTDDESSTDVDTTNTQEGENQNG